MSKSSQAFRTIREVADWLGVAAHVLRFWESKFSQIKPVKRAGGRRYYRPADMELVGGIKVLLHDRGLTIRGVQKMMREEGVAVVAALSPPLDLGDLDRIGDDAVADWVDDADAERSDTVVAGVERRAATDSRQTRLPFAEEEHDEVREIATATAGAGPAAERPDDGAQPPAPAVADVEAGPVPQVAGVADSTALHPPARSAIDRLADLVARASQVPSDARSRARPALTALRDRMRTEPSDRAG
jgi:DNA-binding transcriptional MerR regulator